ncbi:MAG: helix-hairpin-helix domain-containing protein [Chloroflexota bacterium]
MPGFGQVNPTARLPRRRRPVTIGDRIAVAALAAALVAVALGAWLLFAVGSAAKPAADALLDPFASATTSFAAATSDLLVVDVEGAVLRPGIIEAAAGSRVSDAVAAAGGYSPLADLAAAAAQVNLAAVLRDGQQIVVPQIGVAAAGGSTAGGGSGGLVNLNSATPEALDALPGIGPVTVQKIVAARTQKPFATLEELLTRKVLTNAQLDKIRDLVTLV